MMLNAGARGRSGGASPAPDAANDSVTVSESSFSSLDDHFVDDDDASLEDGDEEEGIARPTQSVALNVDVGKRDSIDTSYSSLDFIPEEEEGEGESSQSDAVENTSEGSSEDSKDYFCGETLDRPSLQHHHGKDDPLDLSGGKTRPLRSRPTLTRGGVGGPMQPERRGKAGLGVLIWESNVEDTSVKIPSWSKQDRFKRALVIPKRKKVLFGSSIFLGLIFLFTYLLPESLRSPEGSAMRCSIALPIFILLQTFVTLITAIPGEDSTNKEINQRINASILIAMTLYPCLGLWIATRTRQLEAGTALQTLGIDHLWNLHDDESGTYQWGYIFP